MRFEYNTVTCIIIIIFKEFELKALFLLGRCSTT
jgi:hypothetical protein